MTVDALASATSFAPEEYYFNRGSEVGFHTVWKDHEGRNARIICAAALLNTFLMAEADCEGLNQRSREGPAKAGPVGALEAAIARLTAAVEHQQEGLMRALDDIATIKRRRPFRTK